MRRAGALLRYRSRANNGASCLLAQRRALAYASRRRVCHNSIDGARRRARISVAARGSRWQNALAAIVSISARSGGAAAAARHHDARIAHSRVPRAL